MKMGIPFRKFSFGVGNKWIIIILFKSFMKGIFVVRIQIFAYMYIPHDCVLYLYIFIFTGFTGHTYLIGCWKVHIPFMYFCHIYLYLS